MSLLIKTSRVGEVTVLTLSGRLTLGNQWQVRDYAREILASGRNKLVLNVSECAYVDSSGLSEIVSAFTASRNRGGNLVIAQPSLKFSDLMKITRCNKIFKIFATEEEAVNFLASEATQGKP